MSNDVPYLLKYLQLIGHLKF